MVMARPTTIINEELLDRLSSVFRDVGYDGASMATLSEATSLKKASLYHRFPGGKEQMAQAVLGATGNWLSNHVIRHLLTEAPPKKRIQKMIHSLREYYDNGAQSCLLNLLCSSRMSEKFFAKAIKDALESWISALNKVVADAGYNTKEARYRAQRAVVVIQGSLIVSRGLRTTKPFEECLKRLPKDLIE